VVVAALTLAATPPRVEVWRMPHDDSGR